MVYRTACHKYMEQLAHHRRAMNESPNQCKYDYPVLFMRYSTSLLCDLNTETETQS